jgi:hypothetical protein
MKPTQIAHLKGYTTTRQLHNTIEGKSMLSTKAIKGLIENLNVNPFYLFLGKGEIFLSDESEAETLHEENLELIQRNNDTEDLDVIRNFLKNNLQIEILTYRENDYRNEYTVIEVSISLDGEEICSSSDTIR